MKKLSMAIVPLLFAGILLFAQPGQQGKGNQDNKSRKENSNKSNKANTKDAQGQKGNQGNNGKDRVVSNQGNGNGNSNGQGNNKGKGNNGDAPGLNRDDRSRGNDKVDITLGKNNLPQFNRDNFKNRKEFFKGEKVTICHKASDGNPVSITVSANALQAHLNHGDSRGNCTYRSGIFSDDFWKRRETFFNLRERTRDQVVYSQGILQYALQRLTDERSELVLLRNQNAPATVITVQETRVNELDNNVSLLQTLLSSALTLIAD